MTLLNLLAHSGQTHETTTQAVNHSLSSGATFWILLIVVPPIILLMARSFKAKLSTQVLLVSFYLVVYGLLSYQRPGPYSVIAISVGFGLTLLSTVISLSVSDK